MSAESKNGKSYLDERFEIDDSFSRFDQKNDIFNRAIWDDTVDPKHFFKSYDIANYKPKKSKGFDHWDYAFRNASWHLTDYVGELHFQKTGKVEGFTDTYTSTTPGSPNKIKDSSAEYNTQRIKQAAKMFGAGMVGMCKLDKRWVYRTNYNRLSGESQALEFPESMTMAIVLVVPMDYKLSKTFPSALSGASTGLGYSTSLSSAITLAQFITNLGYEALASLNDTALSIPMAIEAGLGEYGRNGLLITPKYGPNVRIAKVFTDLPLIADRPREFGVQKFCNQCNRCAKGCPVKAIPYGPPQKEPPNFSSLSGIKKWTVNAEKCFKFWVGMNSDCAICIRVCPYNKDYSKWYHRLGIKLSNSPLRKVLLWLDDKLGFGKRHPPQYWWNQTN